MGDEEHAIGEGGGGSAAAAAAAMVAAALSAPTAEPEPELLDLEPQTASKENTEEGKVEPAKWSVEHPLFDASRWESWEQRPAGAAAAGGFQQPRATPPTC